MIKLIAFLSMLIDHIGLFLFPNQIFFTIIGRLAFPLFAWGVSKGFKLTKNFNRYALRIAILAIISQLPYTLLFKNGNLNICFTLLIGLFFLKVYSIKINIVFKSIILIFLLLLAHVFDFEYGIFGILTIAVFYIFSDYYYLLIFQFFAILLGVYIYRFPLIEFISLFSLLVIALLGNKYNFKINAKISYGFYPAHLFLLLIFNYFV